MLGLKYTTYSLLALYVLTYLYVLSLYVPLHRRGVITTYKRLSFKILNDAIHDRKSDDPNLERLVYLKRIYAVSVFLFWSSFISVLILIVRNAAP